MQDHEEGMRVPRRSGEDAQAGDRGSLLGAYQAATARLFRMQQGEFRTRFTLHVDT